MTGRLRRQLTLSTFLLAATPAWASGSAGDEAVARAQAEAGSEQAGQVMSAGSPNSRTAAGFSAANVQFTQEGDETSVSVAFSLDLTSYRRAPTEDDRYYHFRRTKLTAVASTPIESGGKDADLFRGDSLVSGSKLKLSLVSFSTKVGTGQGAGPAISAAYQQCISQNARQWVAMQPDRIEAGETAGALVGGLNERLAWRTSGVNFDGIMEDTGKNHGDLGKVLVKACHPGADDGALNDEYDLVSKYGKDPATFGKRFLPENAKLTFWGVDASIGRDDYDILDRTAFKLESKPRTSWEVGAFYGWMNSDLTFSLRGRAVYGQNYENQAEAEICRTVSIPAGTECIKGPDGAPIRNRTGLVSIEARKLVTVKEGTKIAFAPQVTYRFEDKNLGVELPVYLAPDKDGKLNGGIKAVYNSKGDEFAVGLFIGVPFSIFYD